MVARSLERAWENKLRLLETVEQSYQAWQREQTGPLTNSERTEVLKLAKDFHRVWQLANSAERKRIVRLVIKDVALEKMNDSEWVSLRITWQTGCVSEHMVRRRVQSYSIFTPTDRLEKRIRQLTMSGMFDREIAENLNKEQFVSARGVPFQSNNVHLLRKRFGIRTAKINGIENNPARWPDGTYSIQGAADALGITTQTVFKWLHKGRLTGKQNRPGQPWKLQLSSAKIRALKSRVRRIKQSKTEAS